MAFNQKTRIHARIVDLVKAAEFRPIEYSPEGYCSVSTTKIEPASASNNEVQARFERDKQNGRKFTLKRENWLFQLLLKFNSEVSLEEFENGLLADPPTIERDGLLPQVTLELVDKVVIHPTQQQSDTGTDARYTFRVNEWRG